MRYVIILLLGLIVGAGAAVFFLGTPRAKSTPGTQVQAPEAGGDTAGTVVVTLTNGFVQKFLATIFQDLGAPSFQLAGIEPAAELYRHRAHCFPARLYQYNHAGAGRQ